VGENSLRKAFKFHGMGAHSIPSIFHRQNVSGDLDFQHENTENLMLYLCNQRSSVAKTMFFCGLA
jgi:hypothetical protein